MFSVPFRDGSEAEDLSGRPPLVLATHAVFVESRGHRAPAAVVGLHFQLDSLARHFLNVTSTVNNFVYYTAYISFFHRVISIHIKQLGLLL